MERLSHGQAFRYTLMALSMGTEDQAAHGAKVAKEHGMSDYYQKLMNKRTKGD